mmetsp:Transcript_34359/g.80294  ORF Transcript_34359/g.80294 Transcript_34359/m.80294 type:complete len:196 (-) Transcript_34359:26-613(-)
MISISFLILCIPWLAFTYYAAQPPETFFDTTEKPSKEQLAERSVWHTVAAWLITMSSIATTIGFTWIAVRIRRRLKQLPERQESFLRNRAQATSRHLTGVALICILSFLVRAMFRLPLSTYYQLNSAHSGIVILLIWNAPELFLCEIVATVWIAYILYRQVVPTAAAISAAGTEASRSVREAELEPSWLNRESQF